MIMYDLTPIMDDPRKDYPNDVVRVITVLWHPHTVFYSYSLEKVVKNEKAELEFNRVKFVLADLEAQKMLYPHRRMLLFQFKDGTVEMLVTTCFTEEHIYKLEQELNVGEDEVVVTVPVGDETWRYGKMKIASLPVTPLPQITDQMIEEAKLKMATGELDAARKQLEQKYGVALTEAR